MKKKVTYQYYSLDNIDRYDTSYKIIIGERSNGKTYSVKKKIIDTLKNEDVQFIYMRRRHAYIVRSICEKVFADINKYAEKELGAIIQYNINGEFYLEKEDGEIKIIGHSIAVEDAYNKKGISFPNTKYILFDEFIDKEYMLEELELFMNVMSTITRGNEHNLTVYMLGNTVSKACPYFKLFGIDPSQLRQGKISVISHKRGVSAAVEYCKTLLLNSKTLSDKKNKFIGFDDDETVSMIMFGSWEAKSLPIHSIDGVTWNCKDRMLIPIYITGLEKTFEISISVEGVPVGFCRIPNTQDGNVNQLIKYNISYDGTQLKTVDGYVPTFNHITSLIDVSTKMLLDIFIECVRCGRVLYTNIQDGTEFLTIFNALM
jgi:hypothetical protein